MDGTQIRTLARLVGELARSASVVAGRLGAANEVTWVSVAAGEFRRQLAAEQARIARAVTELDAAVAMLLWHAACLDTARPFQTLAQAWPPSPVTFRLPVAHGLDLPPPSGPAVAAPAPVLPAGGP
jgi:hypothetical protein